ncbi:MAG: FG-GAP-like repeat-containing protein, partial [Lentisphaeria bacterium]|nr:FG-GAP-like repeat-containing protein [Lentisphaeria bacterium]
MKNRLTVIGVLCLVFLLYAQQHSTGVILPSDGDAVAVLSTFRSYSLPVEKAEVQVRSALPASHVNFAHLPVVSNQGGMGICGSFAPTYYLGNYYLSLRDGGGRYNPKMDSAKMVSPLWSVYMFRHGGTGSQPNGGDPVDSIRGLCEQGYLTLAEMPFTGAPPSTYYLPNVATQKKALARRFGGYGVTLSDIATPEGLEKLKAALRNGDIFVAITKPIPLNFDQYPNENAAWGDDARSNNNGVFAWPVEGITREPHAVTIIGYDDTKRYVGKDGQETCGALLAVNSWGTNWGVKYNGEGGYIWIGYESGFLEGTCYSLKPGTGGYAPSLTAIISVETAGQGDTPWIDKFFPRAWLHNLEFTLNGHTLSNPIPANYYLTGLEENPKKAEILVDLSGYDDIDFWQLGTILSFGGQAKLGDVRSVKIQDGNGDLLWQKDTEGFELKPYSGSYPTCKYYLSLFAEQKNALPEIYPHTGSFALGDFNGDGRLDVVAAVRQGKAVANSGCEYQASLFFRQKDGSWKSQDLQLNLEGLSRELLAVDLDGDGVLDLAATDGAKAVFLKNDGKGNFTQSASVNVTEEWNNSPGCFATADFDNDGKPDFALINAENTVVIRQDTPSKYVVYPIGNRLVRPVDLDQNGKSLAVGDINGDGWTDIVAIGRTKEVWQNQAVLYFNRGDMTFAPHVLPLKATEYNAISVADADQDGCDDILCTGVGQLAILMGRPDVAGAFQMPNEAQVSTSVDVAYGGNVAWCDLDMDGRMEAVVAGTTTGVTSSSADPYGEDNIGFPLHDYARNYLKILRWDGTQFVDANMALPGTVGFAGPSLLCVKDFDGDGKPDIVHGGCYGFKSVVFSHQGPNRSVCGMTFLRNEFQGTATAPSAPTALVAKALGKGQARLSWQASTGTRFALRIGTASGKSDVFSPANGSQYKSGIVLNHLPAKKLYWAVRAVDAAGNLSPWSAENNFTPNGTAAVPSPAAKCPDEIALPQYTFTCTSEDAARGSVTSPGPVTCGQEVILAAMPKAGWRFACWTGDGLLADCLSEQTTAKIYGKANVTAHFIPDDRNLKIDERHLGFRDAAGNLWFYDKPLQKVPYFSAAAGCTFFTLADGTAYFDRIGPRAWNQRLLRALDGTLWFNAISANFGDADGLGGYLEQTQAAWGGPGGLAVRYDFEQTNAQLWRELAVVHANYDSYPEATIRSNEEIACCVPQKSFMLLLTSRGRVRFIGLNDSGQFGAVAPYRLKECTEIAGLPEVFTVTAGTGFAAAIDFSGALWTWGDNRVGQLGRGKSGGILAVPGKVTGLPSKVVAVAAGDNHLAALCEDGSLHVWGDNSSGQLGAANGLPLSGKRVTAIAAAGNRTAALAEDVIYLWGDGETAPVAIDRIDFETVQCQIKVDDRAAALLSEAAGNRVGRKDIPITLQADSEEKTVFQYWLVNNVRHEGNSLTVTLTDKSTVEAVDQLTKPLVSFGEPKMTDS